MNWVHEILVAHSKYLLQLEPKWIDCIYIAALIRVCLKGVNEGTFKVNNVRAILTVLINWLARHWLADRLDEHQRKLCGLGVLTFQLNKKRVAYPATKNSDHATI